VEHVEDFSHYQKRTGSWMHPVESIELDNDQRGCTPMLILGYKHLVSIHHGSSCVCNSSLPTARGWWWGQLQQFSKHLSSLYAASAVAPTVRLIQGSHMLMMVATLPPPLLLMHTSSCILPSNQHLRSHACIAFADCVSCRFCSFMPQVLFCSPF